jgi:adenylate cyclase
MAQEIERKFLVTSNLFKREAHKETRITQGYLCSIPERTVRVRIKADKGFITIKGKANATGTSRYEWEKEIPAQEASLLLQICEPGTIDKTRFEVKAAQHIFEVDEFYGENTGLIVAEIELQHEDEDFEKPSWLGEEVTGIAKYYNSSLKEIPFLTWK